MIKKLVLKILKLLERFLQTDAKYLAKGTFWLMLGRIAGMLAAFLLSVAYARYLFKGVYGDYRYILSLLGMAGIFTLPGMGSSIVRSVARGFSGTFRRGSSIIFFCSFGITIVAFAAAFFFLHQQKFGLALGFAAAAPLIPLVEGLGSWRAYLNGKKEFRKKTLFNIFIQIFYVAVMLGTVLGIYFLRLSAVSSAAILIAAYCVGRGLPNIYFFFKTRNEVSKNAPQDPGAIRYGLQLSLSGIPSTMANYLDAILLYHFLGPASLAVYSFAIALPEQLKAFFGTMVGVGFPKLSAKTVSIEESKQIKQTLPLKIIKASLITAGIVLIYILLAPYIYQIFFPRYLESIYLSQIFALSLILFPFGVFGTALTAQGSIKKIYIYRIGSPIIQIIALIVLIPIWGLWGAVLGRLISRILHYFLLFVLFKA